MQLIYTKIVVTLGMERVVPKNSSSGSQSNPTPTISSISAVSCYSKLKWPFTCKLRIETTILFLFLFSLFFNFFNNYLSWQFKSFLKIDSKVNMLLFTYYQSYYIFGSQYRKFILNQSFYCCTIPSFECYVNQNYYVINFVDTISRSIGMYARVSSRA